MTTTLFVLTKNEVEGMRAIMPQVKKEWCDQILVVDGNSTDGTIEYARSKGYDVYVQRKPGLRAAYQESWPLIKGEYVITFSPDGNSPPEYIPRLIEKINEGYDMVIGSRYYQGLKSADDDALTSFGNWLFTTAINVLHNGKYSDAMTIYRIYKKNLFYEMGLHEDSTYALYEKMYFTHIGIEPVLSVRCAKERLKTADIACPEPARIGGVRKLQIVRWGLAYMTQVVFEKFTPKRNPRQ
ncbi:MAG: glycosyltransferase family 2 protein [Chitinispirillaceae bacterium]|nr:glycosyltransferase family 2 protein [Chitinispirillaceae bacterium]